MALEDVGGITIVRYLAVGLFFGMLVMLEVGRWLGHRRLARDPGATGLGPLEGAIFGLLGLLVAFTFSGAASRLDMRRALVVEEANDIGTAYARIDMLPDAAQPRLRDLFRRYVDARIGVYRALPDRAAAWQGLERASALQGEIWTAASAACRSDEGRSVAMLVLPPINAMFDITTTRTMAALHHPPTLIYAMLIVLALVSALLAGHGMAAGGRRSWVHALGFAAVMAVVIYVIIDLEYPRFGVLRVDAADRALEQVRAAMDPR